MFLSRRKSEFSNTISMECFQSSLHLFSIQWKNNSRTKKKKKEKKRKKLIRDYFSYICKFAVEPKIHEIDFCRYYCWPLSSRRRRLSSCKFRIGGEEKKKNFPLANVVRLRHGWGSTCDTSCFFSQSRSRNFHDVIHQVPFSLPTRRVSLDFSLDFVLRLLCENISFPRYMCDDRIYAISIKSCLRYT